MDAVGARIGIDLSPLGPAERAAVLHAWDDARSPGRAVPDAIVTPSTAPLAQVLSDLSSAVTLRAIDAGRGRLLMLHAAGLAAPDGRVTVLVGPSGAGKTTATRTLAARRGYVTDETVGIDGAGTVLAYRKPLSIITEGHPFKVQRRPGDLGLRALPEGPLRVGRVVLLDRRRDPLPARLRAVTRADALAALAPHCSALAALPRPLHTLSRVLDETGGALRVEYHEASDLISLLTEMDAAPSAPVPTDRRDGRADDADRLVLRVDPDATAPRLERAPTVDWLPVDAERLAVLTAKPDGAGTLRILAGLAPLLWEHAPGTTVASLVRAAVDAIGDPAAEAGVRGILDELVDAGLLALTP